MRRIGNSRWRVRQRWGPHGRDECAAGARPHVAPVRQHQQPLLRRIKIMSEHPAVLCTARVSQQHDREHEHFPTRIRGRGITLCHPAPSKSAAGGSHSIPGLPKFKAKPSPQLGSVATRSAPPRRSHIARQAFGAIWLIGSECLPGTPTRSSHVLLLAATVCVRLGRRRVARFVADFTSSSDYQNPKTAWLWLA